MAASFESGFVVELLIAFFVLEALALIVLYRATGRGIPTRWLWPSFTAGLCLMLALRASLVDDGWGWIALWLAIALFAHLADLRSRWRR